VAFKVAETTLPAYSSEFSKRMYTQHQLMALFCLMKRLKLKYREFIATIELMPKIQEIIELKNVPHYTTLQKFFIRFGSNFFDEMLSFTMQLFFIHKPWAAVDGTGHSCDQASLYYTDKIEKQTKKWRKSYTKNQIAIDTRTQVILAHKVTKGL